MADTKNTKEPIIIVSGLPRSGTSMMMSMLQAGGLEIMTDQIRKADIDNPQGYFEFEKVKNLRNQPHCLDQARGKAVKVISQLLYELPSKHDYKIIFIQRNMQELLASQKKMLVRRGEDPDAVPDDVMAGKFEDHLRKVRNYIAKASNMECCYLDYNDSLKSPAVASRQITDFLQLSLNVEAMTAAVNPNLYRNKVV